MSTRPTRSANCAQRTVHATLLVAVGEVIRCSRCGADLPPEAFAPAHRRPGDWCRACRKTYMAEYQWRIRGAGAVHGPKLPPQPKVERVCQVCGAPARRTLCANPECAKSANNERTRQRNRRMRDNPTPQWTDSRRRGWSRRRAVKRGARAEPYSRTAIAERDRWRCHLCGKPIAKDQIVPHPRALTMDHVVPLARGGDDVAANIRIAHFLCNATKGLRAMDEQLMMFG